MWKIGEIKMRKRLDKKRGKRGDREERQEMEENERVKRRAWRERVENIK